MNRIRVSLEGQRSYEVVAGSGVLSALPDLLREHCPAHRYAVIADHHVAELHGRTLMAGLQSAGVDAALFHFPSGEWNKTRETWAALTDRLLAARFGRDCAILGFGGGVAGDLAGFVAATFLRGVPLVQLPTTLLAMVDASVGGKTGLDVPAGKNLVGAFHAPCAVVADLALLATLPRAQLQAGMAEIIKHGVVADAAYFERVARAPLAGSDAVGLEPLVVRSIEIKAGIVSDDERETGRRAILNFGHTVAHAIESLSGYELLHGEAVAIGMVAEARLANLAGVASAALEQRLRGAIEMHALPTGIPQSLSSEALIEAMRADKKVRAGAIRFALPRDLGHMARGDDGGWTLPVEEPVIRQLLDSRPWERGHSVANLNRSC